MAHKHPVYDTDTHFIIDGVTRAVKNVSSVKTMLVQHDHNSERFTFEVPSIVDGHEMILCNRVEVHYINIDSTDKTKVSKGVYAVDDLVGYGETITPLDGESESDSGTDKSCAVFSWLISSNATKYVGNLSFVIRFACVSEDGTVDYVWNTAVHSAVSVVTGIYNGEAVVEEYADVLEQWRQELFSADVVELEARLEALGQKTKTEVEGLVERVTELEQNGHMIDDSVAYIRHYESSKAGAVNYDYNFVAGHRYKIKNNSSSYMTVRTWDANSAEVDVLGTVEAGQTVEFVATQNAVILRIYYGVAGIAEFEDLSKRLPVAEENIERIDNKAQSIESLSIQRIEIPEAELIAGKYVSYEGKESTNADWCCSDYIKLDKVAYGTNISIPTTLGNNSGIVFFGIDKKVISYITKSIYGSAYVGNLITKIPQGAEYVRFSLELRDIEKVDLAICNAVSGVPKEIEQKLQQLTGQKETVLVWRIGGISYDNGKVNNSVSNRIRTGFIPITGYGCTVDFSGDGKFLVFEYSSNDENSNLIVLGKSDWRNTPYTVTKDECKYIRIAATKTDESDFDEESAAEFGSNFTVTQTFLHSRAVGKYVSLIKEDFHYDGAVEEYSEQNKLSTIYAKWEELATNYPAIVQKTVLGEVGGKEIRSYRITPTCSVLNTMDVAGFSSEPLKILFISCVHGNEGTIALDDFTMFKNLVENHTPRVLWNNCVFEVIPVANPVGYDANSRLNGNGININRNFPVGWVYADKTEDPYNASGDAPCSEYETNLLMDFVKANPDAFLVLNRHGTDPWGVDGKEGYAASAYQAEIDTAIASACATDTMLRDIYEDINVISPNNCIFSVAHGSRFNGSFDRWFNHIGYHGYLLEYCHRTNTEPPIIDNDNVRRVGITAIANLLCDSVLNNRNILGNENKISSKFDV